MRKQENTTGETEKRQPRLELGGRHSPLHNKHGRYRCGYLSDWPRHRDIFFLGRPMAAQESPEQGNNAGPITGAKRYHAPCATAGITPCPAPRVPESFGGRWGEKASGSGKGSA